MKQKKSLMRRFWESACDALDRMGNGFEVANRLPEWPTAEGEREFNRITAEQKARQQKKNGNNRPA